MSLRDLFARKPMPPDVAAAAKLLDEEHDERGAFSTLRAYMTSDNGDRDSAALASSLSLFVRISRALGAGDDKLFHAVEGVIKNTDDADLLWQLGFELYEQSLFDLAAVMLSRANRVRPGDPRIVCELATTLEHLLRYQEAFLLLEASGLCDRDPLCAYLSGFHAFMCAKIDVTRKRAKQIENADDERLAFMHDTLRAWIERADALVAAGIDLEGEHTLSAWHAAINGTVLLHESPYGWDEPMRGRYAFVADSPSLMREGLDRLAAVVADAPPARVVATPDRASRILATAAAKRLSRPLVEWHDALPGGLADSLVVVWDQNTMGDTDVAEALMHRAPGQFLFAHASAWVDPFPYAADVTTFLYQSVTHPFAGGALVVGADNKVSRAAADARSIDELANEILAATISYEGASKTDIALVLRIRDALKPLVSSTSPKRPRQRAGSPVMSNRFT